MPIESTDFSKNLEKHYSNLRRSEKKVADYILQSPDEISNLSITELAKRSSTSETTVNRLCRSLGYAGYRKLKIVLAQDVATSKVRTIPQSINENDDTQTVGRKLDIVLEQAIKRTSELLNPSGLERAIDSISRADKVYFYGIGGSGAVAHIAHHLLLKAGFFNTAYDDGYMQAVSAALLTKRDTAIGISHSGNTRDVVEAIRIAKRCKATTIAITGNEKSAIAKEADILLFTISEEEPIYGDFMEAKVSQLYVLDLLYIGLLLRNISAANERLEETASAIWSRSYKSDSPTNLPDEGEEDVTEIE